MNQDAEYVCVGWRCDCPCGETWWGTGFSPLCPGGEGTPFRIYVQRPRPAPAPSP